MFHRVNRISTYPIYYILFATQNLDRKFVFSRVLAIYLAPWCRQGLDVVVDDEGMRKGQLASTLVIRRRGILCNPAQLALRLN